MDEQIRKHVMDQLERNRERINKKLDFQRERINERFDQKLSELNGKLNFKQEQIIEAALELLTEGGLNDLSLRDIAKKIDIKAPALYWYFKSKSDLIDYMAEAILSREFAGAKPRANDETWQDWLSEQMTKLRKAMLAYPDGGRVVAGARLNPAKTLAQLFDNCILSLTSAGIDQKTALYITMTATQYTFGFVIEEQAGPKPEDITTFVDREFSDAYPSLARAVKEYRKGTDIENKAYAAGLQLIIKGAQAK